MSIKSICALTLGTGLTLIACSPVVQAPMQSLSTGAQVPAAQFAKTYAGKYACANYDASSDTCASVSRWTVSGDTVSSVETGAFIAPDGPVTMTVTSKSRFEGDALCLEADGMSIETDSEDPGADAFIQEVTKSVIEEAGGVCATYFEAEDGYVVRTVGRDGEPFPPGDTAYRIFDTQKRFRAE